jgi:sigma-B regulation protein RsbU (phosphoserine phosphatase)
MRDGSGTISHYVSVGKDVTELRKLQEHEYQLKLARSVQQRFYTMEPPQVEGFDIGGASFPADATGGDYFDFVRLPRGHLGIAVGDVSGHGISSALLMVELRSSLPPGKARPSGRSSHC